MTQSCCSRLFQSVRTLTCQWAHLEREVTLKQWARRTGTQTHLCTSLRAIYQLRFALGGSELLRTLSFFFLGKPVTKPVLSLLEKSVVTSRSRDLLSAPASVCVFAFFFGGRVVIKCQFPASEHLSRWETASHVASKRLLLPQPSIWTSHMY